MGKGTQYGAYRRGVKGFVAESDWLSGTRPIHLTSIIAGMVSEHSDHAYYLQEEVAIAVALSRDPSSSIRIIPVLLHGATQSHLPYGTFTLHALSEDRGGWPAVAEAIAFQVLESQQRPRSAMLGGAAEGADGMWSRLEPGLTGRGRRLVVDYDRRFRADGEAMVALDRAGSEVQRVTREELADRLPHGLLHHIEVLERSMEINQAIWDERYPRRVIDESDKELAERALRAIADDLAVLRESRLSRPSASPCQKPMRNTG